jgi:hypothetical protein
MVLSNEQVFDIILSGTQDKIKLARKKAKKINMHITGKNVIDFLEKLDGYETNAQKILREKLVKTNRSLFSFILRPMDKIFTAKGGAVNYNLPTTKINYLKENINDVADGLDIKKYLKKVVRKQYIIDPNGVLFIDIDNEGKLETHVVNTNQIFWYENKGNRVKAIIFEPYKKELSNQEMKAFEVMGSDRLKKEKEKLYYRVIDDSTDRIFVKDGNKITLQEDILDNYFGFVPAIILGDEKNPNYDIFESFIEDIVDDADEMLRDISVEIVHKLAHAYPRYWSYAQACTRCGGEGEIQTITDNTTDPVTYESVVCPSCGGEGHKTTTNPDDEIVLSVPEGGEPIIAPNVAGFVQPDLGTMEFYSKTLERKRNLMFQSIWGTTYEQGGKRETATGRFLDAQPVQDRLRDCSDTFSKLHKFMLDCYAKVLLQDKTYESSVSYGMRYILESPDDILDKLIEVSREKVSDVVKLDQKLKYIEAEYQNDPIELIKRRKLCKIEPFATMTPIDVSNIEWIDEEDKKRKMYFAEWSSKISEEELIFLTEEQLTEKLNQYINLKKTIDGTTV